MEQRALLGCLKEKQAEAIIKAVAGYFGRHDLQIKRYNHTTDVDLLINDDLPWTEFHKVQSFAIGVCWGVDYCSNPNISAKESLHGN